MLEEIIQKYINQAAERAAERAVQIYALKHQDKADKYGNKMTPKQVCAESGMALQTLYQKKCNGQIPGAVKLGGKLFFETAVVLPWIEAGCPPLNA